MLVQIREEELKKLKNKVRNYRQVIRTHEKNKQAAQAKAAFNDTEKLIILEACFCKCLTPATRRQLLGLFCQSLMMMRFGTSTNMTQSKR